MSLLIRGTFPVVVGIEIKDEMKPGFCKIFRKDENQPKTTKN